MVSRSGGRLPWKGYQANSSPTGPSEGKAVRMRSPLPAMMVKSTRLAQWVSLMRPGWAGRSFIAPAHKRRGETALALSGRCAEADRRERVDADGDWSER